MNRNNLPQSRRWLPACLAMVLACGGVQTQSSVGVTEGDLPTDWPARPVVDQPIEAKWPSLETQVVGGEKAGTGVHLVAVGRHDSPALFLRWVLPGGRALEYVSGTKLAQRWPEGTVQLTAELLQMGTQAHPGTAFATALANLGAQVDVLAVPDAVVLDVHVLAHRLPQVLDLVHELLTQPQLADAQLAGLKDRHVGELQNDAQSPERVAQRVARRLLYGPQHPYGSPGLTLESVTKITRKHVVEAAGQAFRVGGSHLIAVGDVDVATLAAAVQKSFGADLQLPGVAVTLPAPASEATASGCHFVSIPGATQNALVVATRGPARADPQWAAWQVVNQLLGGSASSRLFTELREKRGLGYGASSWLEGRRLGGGWLLAANVRADATLAALDVVHTQLKLLATNVPELEELRAAQRFLAGQFAMRLADGDDLADLLAVTPLYQLAEGTQARYLADVQSLAVNDVPPLAQRWTHHGDAIVVLAGDPATLRPGLDAQCTRVVEHDAQGNVLRLYVGPDREMSAAGRASAFALWTRSPAGLEALQRYVTQTDHRPRFRAEALAMLGASPASDKVLEIGRQATDWPQVCAEMVSILLARLGTRSHEENAEIRKTVLALADTATRTDGGVQDLTPEAAEAARRVLAHWAISGAPVVTPTPAVTPGKRGRVAPPTLDDSAASQAARLSPGDLQRLGPGLPPATLGQWIAANLRRHEAADVLLAQKTPAATDALVAGYRTLLATGEPPDAQDLAALAAAGSADGLVLLLGAHAAMERSADVDAQLAAMRTIRAEVARLSPEAMKAQFDRVGPYLEGLLTARNADDRWWAAELLVQFGGNDGLRRVLQDMAVDGHYRDPKWHTVDPKVALVHLVQSALIPAAGDALQPQLLATLVRRQTLGKIIAVTALKALGDDASLAALKTVQDDTDVAPYLDLQAPLSVHEMALAAVDVIRFIADVTAQEKAGKLDAASAVKYREAAFGTVDLFDKRLRAEVHRIVTRAPALPEPTPDAPTGTGADR